MSRLVPWLEREMASENQVERYQFLSTSTFQEDEHPSEILRTRSEPHHRLGELYKDMPRKDADLSSFMAKRIEAVVKLPRHIVPREPSPQALETADFCVQAVREIKSFDKNLAHQLLSRPEGSAFDELVWEEMSRGPLSGAAVPVAMIDRPMHRFAFKKGVLHVRQKTGDPIPAPPGKFLVMTHGTKDGPWGLPLLDNVYWPYFTKLQVLKWYCIYAEKFGSPTPIVKYPWRGGDNEAAHKTNRENQQRALKIANAIQQQQAFSVPVDIIVELLEASRGGDAGYNQFLQAQTRSEALVFLGEINTSGLRPGTGAYASEEVSNSIRYEKVALDAHALGAHLTDQLLRPLVEINFGPLAPVPRFEIQHIDAEDIESRREGIHLLREAGLPVPTQYAYMSALCPEPRDGEEVVDWAKSAPSAPVTDDDEDDDLPLKDENDEDEAEVAAAAAPSIQLSAPDLTEELALAEARLEALDNLASQLLEPTLGHYQHQRDVALQGWEQGRLTQPDGLAWLAEQFDPTAQADLIHGAQIHGMGLALAHLREDGIGTAVWRDMPSTGDGLLDLPLSAPAEIQLQAPPDAGQHPGADPAIAYWADLLQVPPGIFSRLSDQARRSAFKVAGIDNAQMLQEIQKLVQQGQVEGWKRPAFRERLDQIYEGRGMTPTSDWHADLILQNNIRQANATMRWVQTVGNPAAHSLIPYLGYATIGDDRVRERELHNHRIMSQRVFAIGHEIWRTWWYPAGHGCRCYVYTINRLKAERLGLTGAEPTGPWPTIDGSRALPDPGFQSAPGIIPSDPLDDRLFDVVTEAQASGNTNLLDALERLFSLLDLLARFLGLFERSAA